MSSEYQIQQLRDGNYYVFFNGYNLGGARNRSGTEQIIQRHQARNQQIPQADSQYGSTIGDPINRLASQNPSTASQADINRYNRRMDLQEYLSQGGSDPSIIEQLNRNILNADTTFTRFIQNENQALDQTTAQQPNLFNAARNAAGSPSFNSAQEQAFSNQRNYQNTQSGTLTSFDNIGGLLGDIGSSLVSPVTTAWNGLTNTVSGTPDRLTSMFSDGLNLSNLIPNSGSGDSSRYYQELFRELDNTPSLYTGDTDHRVRLKPKRYELLDRTLLKPLYHTGGLLFPYTPTISYSQGINYNPMDVTHSNQEYYLYKNTSAVEINITGQFTAQNRAEAIYMLSCIHFLRSMSKMHFGEREENPGLPPPVLLLSGYGQFMFNQISVIMRNFQMTLEPNVDYVRVEFNNGSLSTVGWVPTLMTITVSLIAQRNPASWRKGFQWDAFANGDLLREGWI
jgi:hypothetical protein